MKLTSATSCFAIVGRQRDLLLYSHADAQGIPELSHEALRPYPNLSTLVRLIRNRCFLGESLNFVRLDFHVLLDASRSIEKGKIYVVARIVCIIRAIVLLYYKIVYAREGKESRDSCRTIRNRYNE